MLFETMPNFCKYRAHGLRAWVSSCLQACKQKHRFIVSGRNGKTHYELPAVSNTTRGRASPKRSNRIDDTRHALISRLRKAGAGATEELKNVAEELRRRGLLKDAWDYVKVLSPLGKARLWREALQMGEEFIQHGHAPNMIVYNTLISACEKGECWEGALALLSEARCQHLEPDVVSYNSSISACEKGSQWQRGLQLFAELQQHGHLPNIVTYSAAISNCGRAANWAQALLLWSHMKAMDLKADTIIYNATISACEKASEWECALQLLDDMQQHNVPLGVISFSALITACGFASQWQKSLGLLSEMAFQCLQPNLITMNAAISACRSCDKPDVITELLEDTRRLLLSPDKISYGAAITACEVYGMWETALFLFREMPVRCIEPDIIAYNAFLGVCKAAQQWQFALVLVRELLARGHQTTSTTMKAAIGNFAHGLQWNLALEFLADAIDQQVLKGDDAAVKFAEIARACHDLQHSLADNLVTTAFRFRSRESACDCALADVLHWEAGLCLLELSSRLGPQPTWELYSRLILQLLLAGLQAEGMALYREAFDKGLVAPWYPPSSLAAHTIDLHNHWPEIAELAAYATLLQHFLYASRSSHGQLIFITGRGIHSRDGEPKVRPALISLLRDSLGLSVDLQHPGRVIVSASAMNQLWMKLQS